jgi:uncharacterized protein
VSITDLPTLLSALTPQLQEGVFAFCVVDDPTGLTPVVTVQEREGLTVVVPELQALEAGITVLFRAGWITLEVHSDLEAIGLTAAFSTALAGAGISCNVVAGAFHDHIFVPVADVDRAMDCLRALQSAGAT